jgi:hypothetical protein
MSDNNHATDNEVAAKQKTVEIGVALFTMVLAGIVMWDSVRLGHTWGSDGPKAGYFPFYISLILGASGLWNLFNATKVSASKIFLEKGPAKLVLMVLLPLGLYVLAVQFLGIYLASVVYIAVFMVWLGKYKIPMALMVSLGTMLVFFLMFEVWFKVPLLKGPLEAMFGLA